MQLTAAVGATVVGILVAGLRPEWATTWMYSVFGALMIVAAAIAAWLPGRVKGSVTAG